MLGRSMICAVLAAGFMAVQAETYGRKWKCNREPFLAYDPAMGEPECWFADRFHSKEEVEAFVDTFNPNNLTSTSYSKSNGDWDCMSPCYYSALYEQPFCFVSPQTEAYSSSAWGENLQGIKWDYCRPMHDGQFLGQVELYYSAKTIWDEYVDNHPKLKAEVMSAKGIMYEIPQEKSPKNAAQQKLKNAEKDRALNAKRRKMLLEAQHQAIRDKIARDKKNVGYDREIELENMFETIRIAKKRMCFQSRAHTRAKKLRAAKREAERAAENENMTPEELKMEQSGGATSDNPCWTANDEKALKLAIDGFEAKPIKSNKILNKFSVEKKHPHHAASEALNTLKQQQPGANYHQRDSRMRKDVMHDDDGSD